jgi:hypothetical protein
MLNIEKKTNGTELTVALTGRLDTTTAPELDKELKDNLDGVMEREIDRLAHSLYYIITRKYNPPKNSFMVWAV